MGNGLILLRGLVSCQPLKTSRFRVSALGFMGFRVDAVVAFAASPPLGRRTELEAPKCIRINPKEENRFHYPFESKSPM